MRNRAAYGFAISALVTGALAGAVWTGGTAVAQGGGMTYQECMSTGKDSYRQIYGTEAVCVEDGYGTYKLEPDRGQ
ncbi:hypothetical protein [Nocardia sp. NPDC056564]|uniref:hypothetical protein n=1 Tax=Nocardia sp. NPDC056564 TaxID=3345865 RepID=UPI00366AD677